MNFDLLQRGAVSFVASVSTAFNFSPLPTPTQGPLNQPVVIESQNLAGNSPSLNLAQAEDKLQMITKEVEEPKSQDVMLYTVIQPTPKPTKQPKEEEKIALVKEVKAQEVEKPAEEATPTPTPTPTAVPTTPQGSDSDSLFQMINDHRTKIGLKTLEKDENLCKIARGRAPQINDELSSGNLHKGFKDLNLPYWASENIAAYSTIQQDFDFWLSDYIHKKAIEGDYKFTCVACVGASCSQIFTNFINK